MMTFSKKHAVYLSASLLLYIFFVGLYTAWTNQSAEKKIYEDIDQRLVIAAKSLKYMLPRDFHNRAVDKDSISFEEELKNRKAISDYAAETDFVYLYTLVEKNGRFYFSAPTVTQEEARQRQSWYFFPYNDIPDEFVNAYRNEIKAFATYSDQWGTFRSVALPQRSPGGRLYLACADIDIANVQGLVFRQTFVAALTALAFLLLLLPFILVYRSIQVSYNRLLLDEIIEHRDTEAQLLRIRSQLEERVDRRTSELKAANDKLRTEIEERRQTNESLAKAHDILNQSPVVGFLFQNRDGWPVEYVTENVESIFGYSDKAFTSGKVEYFSLVLPEDRERMIQELAKAKIEQGKTFTHEPYRIVTKNGEERWVTDSKSFATNDQGQVTHYQSIIVDITDRKRLQEWVEQTKRIEGLGRVAGGVAHDFNNILMGMVGNVELALAKLTDGSDVRYYLEQLSELCRRAADLVRPMLDFSGKTRPIENNINFSELIRDMAGILQSSISKKATLTKVLADDIPLMNGNPGQLRDVIINLATNASEALGEDVGAVRIATGAIHADEDFFKKTYLYEQQPEGEYVYLEVSDNGAGMTEETQSRIFDPFFSTKFIGRGLGLASVLGIVRGHHGAIKVESAPGQGSKFTVYFPAAPRPCEVTDTKGRTVDTCKGPRQIKILVADDEEQILNMLAEMLEGLGYQVLKAADGSQAIDTFRNHTDEIDIVMLDRTMPKMSGEEAFSEIIRIRNNIPVIFTSGYSEADLPEGIAGRKNVAFIQKPFRLNVLHDTIRAFFPDNQADFS
jgi:PAS domain S-box-containing protein